MSLAAANKKFREGKHQEAADLYEKLLALDPDNVEALHNLGVIAASHYKQLDTAIDLISRSLSLQPNHPERINNLAIILEKQGHLSEARELLESALKHDPNHSASHYTLGSILYTQEFLSEAENALNNAIKYNSKNHLAYNLLGVIYQDQGLFDKAADMYRKAIKADHEYCDPYYNLSNIKKFSKNDKDLKTLQKFASRIKTLNNPIFAKIFYALGKAYHDLGNDHLAFENFSKANQCDRKNLGYDKQVNEGRLQQIAEIFSPEFIAQHESLACQSKVPVFIVGMPRSGTSLIEQILASHPEVHGAGERPELNQLANNIGILTTPNIPYPECLTLLNDALCTHIGEEYLTALQTLAPKATHIIDKMPANFMLIGLIHLIFPNAKIIHCVRDPIDTCFSCFRTNFTSGHEYSNDLEDLGSIYLQYVTLMEHWKKVLPSKILDVEYESMVNDTEQQISNILEYLDLPWSDECLNYRENNRIVKTASVWQVHQPTYTTSISGWKKYASHLQPLIEALTP